MVFSVSILPSTYLQDVFLIIGNPEAWQEGHMHVRSFAVSWSAKIIIPIGIHLVIYLKCKPLLLKG